VITTPRTPRPWVNVVSNGDYGFVVSQTGGGYSWRTHAQLNRITRWEQDLLRDDWGKFIYLRDDRGNIWSAGWKPVCAEPEEYECRHGIGYTVIRSVQQGMETELLMFIPVDDPVEVWQVTIRNRTRGMRMVDVITYAEWCLGHSPDWHREFHKTFAETSYDATAGSIFATKRLWEVPSPRGHWNTDWKYVAFHAANVKPTSFDTDKESFLGIYGSLREPQALNRPKLAGNTGKWLDPIASLHTRIRLKPGETRRVTFLLGAADTREQALEVINKYRSPSGVEEALQGVHDRWAKLLGTCSTETPDAGLNLMLNTWLKYQAISGRLWGRTAYYQTGGAYGFRDQLQDSQLFLWIDPARTLEQIRLHARHQFRDGTVYHWWHPISEIGLQNKITDNLLWLPFVVAAYAEETERASDLDIVEPFVDDPAGATLYEHCMRAIESALTRISPRGLPLIGGGDWNDGLSAVGLEMKGESVWMGHFLHSVLLRFASVAERRGDRVTAGRYRERAHALREAVNTEGWDGEWYYRATTDAGGKVGSRENTQGRIFLNAQTWAVIAGTADPPRAEQVLDAVERHLEFKAGPVLLYPAYTTPDPEIGYLSRYAPGTRENGGVYTHAATWAVQAEAMAHRAEAAWRLYSKILPVHRGKTPDIYTGEPYVTSGNIDGPDSALYGRGGWTWYSGSAAWMFKIGFEWILGIRPAPEGLLIDPCIPKEWKEFKVQREFRGAVYLLQIRNPYGVSSGVKEATVNGGTVLPLAGQHHVIIPAASAGTMNEVTVTMGPIS
jgi:cellobiose phosphorylase